MTLRKCATAVIATWLAYVISVVGADRDPVTAVTKLSYWMDAHGL